MTEPPDFLMFLGRFHPVLVHLPIGLIVVLAFLELLARSPRFKNANSSAGYILGLAVAGSLFTVLCGWLLALGGGYHEKLLGWHRWTGVAVGAAVIIAAIAYRSGLKRLYRVVLFLTIIVLTVSSHFGGSLTHGSDYLVEYAPGPLRSLLGAPAAVTRNDAPANGSTLVANSPKLYPDAVQPVLNRYCVGCHGPEKSKGGLRLDSHPAIAKGGASGPVILAGKPDQSDLLKRLRLPVEHDDHMPPDGKPQPDEEDIKLIEWWVATGASPDALAENLKPTPAIRRILDKRFGPAPAPTSQASEPLPREQALPLAENLSAELAVPILPLGQNEPWLHVNASVAGTNFGDQQLAQLKALARNLQSLDLAGTDVTDAGLAVCTGLVHLKRLSLPRTRITDAGLACLSGLPQLESLNLHDTRITDAGLEHLKNLPALRRVYLWQTAVTPAGAKQLTAAHTDELQLREWAAEIEELKTKIANARFIVDLGAAASPPPLVAAATNAAPVNTTCPVSGKPADSSKTIAYDGRIYAFCCDDCKRSFQQDPVKYLSKSSLASTNSVGPKL